MPLNGQQFVVCDTAASACNGGASMDFVPTAPVKQYTPQNWGATEVASSVKIRDSVARTGRSRPPSLLSCSWC